MGVRLLLAWLVVLLSFDAHLRADHLARSKGGMVVAVSPPGADVGADILKRGGNAVDAAVATAFAMAVTHPAAGNIGGGGFMVVFPGKNKPPVVIDYREKAPLTSHVRMFTKDDTVHTHRAVGVPGTVRGLALAHQQFGKLPWKELVLPSVQLARGGFLLDAPHATSLNSILKKSHVSEEMRRVFCKPDGKDWQAGDRLVQPDLARTLELIAEQGPDAFYKGKIADQLVEEMRLGKGLITHEDLHKYNAVVRQPVHCTYRGFDVYGPPPPSSGGITLTLMLNILEPFELRKKGRWSPETLHLMIEAMRRGYLERARHLGDADFVKIPDHLTSKEYARKLAEGIDPERATGSEALADDIPLTPESSNTTHFSVIDAGGMAVSNTYTLEQSYGSCIMVRGAGFLLNNEMGDFNWFPGVTTRTGRIGTEANLIAPGKRMLSSQTPIIVARDGKVVLVTGSPGGRTIINTVLQVVLNVIEFEMTPREAVDAARIHHQWLPDEVRFEKAKEHAKLVEQLQSRGHRVVPVAKQGDAHSIVVDRETGEYVGVADRRISGKAAGVPAK